jgi:hypothetical protein
MDGTNELSITHHAIINPLLKLELKHSLQASTSPLTTNRR